jgi:hypothetical protein
LPALRGNKPHVWSEIQNTNSHGCLVNLFDNKLATLLGNDDSDGNHRRGLGAVGSASLPIKKGSMADPKAAAADKLGLDAGNVIEVGMDYLSEKDRREMELELQHEMEEVMAEKRKKKLSCLQQTRSGVIKKGDIVKASTLVNSPFTLEELIHMIDVSMNSKYMADLEGMMRTLMDGVRGSLDSIRAESKQELDRLPWQIKATMQQVLGEAREKREFETPDASLDTCNTDTLGISGALGNAARPGNRPSVVNPNLQQPFYQVHSYGPGSQPVPYACFPRPPVIPATTGVANTWMLENVRE